MNDVSCEQDRDRIPFSDLLARRAGEHSDGAAGTLLVLSCRLDLIVDHCNAEGSASHTRPRRALQTYPAFDRTIQQFGAADSRARCSLVSSRPTHSKIFVGAKTLRNKMPARLG